MTVRDDVVPTIAAFLAITLCVGLVASCGGISIGLGPLSIDTAPAPTGTLLYADPDVKVTRPGKGLLSYSPGMQLIGGDTIETGEGEAVIDYEDGSAVMLNRATRVQLGSITLFLGEIFAKIKSVARRGGGQVITSELSASVEGTEYGVSRKFAQPGAKTANVTVYVREGHVLCTPGGVAHWPPVTLPTDRALIVSGNRAPPSPRPVDALALSRWADQAEQRLRKSRLPELRPGIVVPYGREPKPKPQPQPQPSGYGSNL